MESIHRNTVAAAIEQWQHRVISSRPARTATPVAVWSPRPEACGSRSKTRHKCQAARPTGGSLSNPVTRPHDTHTSLLKTRHSRDCLGEGGALVRPHSRREN
jgi:hypothetical protein